MVEQGDQEQIDRLTYLWQAVKRYNANLGKEKKQLYLPGQRGIIPEDDIMSNWLTRAGDKPPSNGRK